MILEPRHVDSSLTWFLQARGFDITSRLIGELMLYIHSPSCGVAGGRHLPTSRPSSTYLPARLSSRADPSALSQSPNVTQARCSGQTPCQVQTPNSQQASRGPVDERTPKGLGNTIPPQQPADQYGTQRSPVQRIQAVSQVDYTQSLASGVAQLNLSGARPNPAQHRSHQPTLTPWTPGNHAFPIIPSMETPSHIRGN